MTLNIGAQNYTFNFIERLWLDYVEEDPVNKMGRLRLTNGIKDSIKEFKHNHENRNFTVTEFKNELFNILHPRFPRIQKEDITRWCGAHNWILEKPEKPKSKVPRKYVSLPGTSNGNSSSYGGPSNATTVTYSYGQQEEILGLPNNVANHSMIAVKTEIFTPQTPTTATQHLHNRGETRQASIFEGEQNSAVNSDDSTVTVLRDDDEAPGGNDGLPLPQLPTIAAIPRDINSVNAQPVLPIRPIPVRTIFPEVYEQTLRFLPRTTGAAAAATSSFPDSSMPHLSPQECSSNAFTGEPPPPSPANPSPINQDPPSSSSYNNAHGYIPPPEAFNYSDPSHLKNFYDAFVSIRSLTDLCVQCPQLQPGLRHLEKLNALVSRVNRNIAMPTTYSQAILVQARRIKQERIANGYSTDCDTEPETEDEREETSENLQRVTTTATNGNRSRRTVITLHD